MCQLKCKILWLLFCMFVRYWNAKCCREKPSKVFEVNGALQVRKATASITHHSRRHPSSPTSFFPLLKCKYLINYFKLSQQKHPIFSFSSKILCFFCPSLNWILNLNIEKCFRKNHSEIMLNCLINAAKCSKISAKMQQNFSQNAV